MPCMTHSIARRFVVAALVCFVSTQSAHADEKLAGVACRSVHLAYTAPEGLAFYNELTVDRSAEGTYFMACGFSMGYFGMQELADGRKVVIFSVWDPGAQNDPNKVSDDQRVKLLHKDHAVRIGRFGNEGTGGQSFLDYDWRIGETCKFLVTAHVDGQRTEYAGWFYINAEKQWKHLVTFSTITGGKALRGYYSFVEDFRRNKVSATKAREAHFGNGWVLTKEDVWVALTQARFTADGNPATNINAGVNGDRFFLVTGGETTNTGTKLNATMTRAPTGIGLPGNSNVPAGIGSK